MIKRKSLSDMTRQDAWTAIRCLVDQGRPITGPNIGEFISHHIQPKTPHRLREWLRNWVVGGALKDDPAHPGAYLLVANPGPEAPRHRRDGTAITIGRGRERMWSVLRVLPRFTALDLAVHASVDDHVVAESHALYYCRALARVGLLRRAPGGYYSLTPGAWTGPLHPTIAADGAVTDRNTGRVHRPPVRTPKEAAHG